MSHVVVFNSSAKTVKILTTPVKYLTEVRDEACAKFNVSKDQFTLKYNNKPISLSQQIRLTNLPQGARLELVQASRSPTVISVALQLPSTEKSVRLTQKFASNTSLWEILRQFESSDGANYNFTQRGIPAMSGDGATGAGRLNYEMPIITVMPGHREQADFVGLQQTLSQLGFENGSALLRLGFRNSGRPLEEAMGEISQYFKGAEQPSASGVHAGTAAPTSSAPVLENAAPDATTAVAGETIRRDEPDPEPMDTTPDPVSSTPLLAPGPIVTKEAEPETENTPPTSSPEVSSSSTSTPAPQTTNTTTTSPPPATTPIKLGSTTQIFTLPPTTTPASATTPFNEADYIPTIEHAKLHQTSLLNKTRNTRLPSDAELAAAAAERESKLAALASRGCSVRIRFPDQFLQTSVGAEDTCLGLYEYVSGFLDAGVKGEDWELRYPAPASGRQVLIPRDASKKLIRHLKFSAAELVTFAWGEGASVEARTGKKTLAREFLERAEVLRVRELVEVEEEKVVSKAEGKKKVGSSSGGGDKESKLRNILGKGLFKR